MNYDLLSPISDRLAEDVKLSHFQTFGRSLKLHSSKIIPDLDKIDIAIIGVLDYRNSEHNLGNQSNINEIRRSLYALFPGNWTSNIADLGDIIIGQRVEDTYFAVSEIVSDLLKNNIIPLIIGGSQDITYAAYRAYDNVKPMVNIINIDKSFDLGDSSKPISNNNYVGKIILEKPYNLFNYTVMGFQTYFNSQQEIDLMEKLYFEYFRLGDLNNDIKFVEPSMRDSDLVTIDLSSVKSSEVSTKQKFSPNGFNGREICAISRYAGISNKVSSFGIYEYKSSIEDDATTMLISQMIWYFIEGFNCRVKDDNFENPDEFNKYTVLVEEQELVFYKSLKTGRWWVETLFLSKPHTKKTKHTLLACMQSDYDKAIGGNIPERWFKAYKKN
ncbi:MAG: arginase [Flavobacteriaceae bacterium]|nr:arginase [Flavobacteriaceae bacterium]|tara:strand:+ start:23253 stop:24410 length:1158 start_codon:yes stop_codon:yes gene_type:complete